jgi:small subunit ribosomal protein S1
MSGRVSQVREFGQHVEVGEGLEGQVHMSAVAWSRGTRPADVAKPGDKVEVEVLKVQLGNRKDRYGKLSLSMKACLPDPWDEHTEVLHLGAARKGKVTSTTDFGAFVELAPGLEGLLHISELGGQDVKHANQVVREGEELDVVIERVDKGQRRISLSRLSAADAEAIARGDIDPEKAPRSLKAGAHVTVVVARVDRRGMKVQVQGVLGKRGRGFISSRDMGDSDGDRRKPIGVGAVLEVKVTGTDRDGSLRCSVRGKEQDEERQAVRAYRKEAAQQGFGTFGDLLRAKIGGGDDA